MLIAIASEGNMVSPHFGHCEKFALYNSETGSLKYLPSPEHQPGLLPQFLHQIGAELVIAGGMGANAQNLLAAAGIQVIVGVSGKIEDIIKTYEKGQLRSSGVVCSEHAGHCHS
ncbi:MAG: NifB/NifX family molybdenum-iron cluster-binding protein [Syntrophomonadaceae bacterium]|jgi:predicted Fe-Mo cluster-binding NifX family protein